MAFKIKVMGRYPVHLPEPYYIEYGPREENSWGWVHAHGIVSHFKTSLQAEKIAGFCGILGPVMKTPNLFNCVEIINSDYPANQW